MASSEPESSEPVSGECGLGVAGAHHNHHLEHAAAHPDLYREPQSLPSELVDAAEFDGATPLQDLEGRW